MFERHGKGPNEETRLKIQTGGMVTESWRSQRRGQVAGQPGKSHDPSSSEAKEKLSGWMRS